MVSLERYQVTHGIDGKVGRVNEGEPRSQATENTGEVMPRSWGCTVRRLHRTHHCVRGSSVTQSCPALCDPMDCSLPDPSVHESLQARILEWVAYSQSTNRTCVSCISCIGRRIFLPLYHPGSPTPQLGHPHSLWLPLCYLITPPTVEDHLWMETGKADWLLLAFLVGGSVLLPQNPHPRDIPKEDGVQMQEDNISTKELNKEVCEAPLTVPGTQ